MAQSSKAPRFLVAAAMRNEGAFLVEWVSWYRMLGFEILIVVNDCTDHSPELLDAFKAANWLRWTTHHPRKNERAKFSAYRKVHKHRLVERTDWLLICDADEFLVLHHDDTIQDYTARFDPPPLGIAFHWRAFGTDGQGDWTDALTHRSFHGASARETSQNTLFKSMFRRPTQFGAFTDHAPKNYSGPWETDNHVWVDCNGERLWRFRPDDKPQKATAPDRIRHDLAQMNHYVLRWRESYGLKRGTPSATAGADRYTDDFFARFDCADEQDQTAMHFQERFDEVYAQAMALPDVHRLHHLCCADYAARLAEKRGIAPEDDPRWVHHRTEAGAD